MSTFNFQSFPAFYQFYLEHHQNQKSRRLHFLGTALALWFMVMIPVTGNWWYEVVSLVCGYGFSWIGHFCYEKNIPNSFNNPLLSLVAGWKMCREMITGKLPF